MSFIKAYIKSMRLYYSFITGIAGWIGVSYYELLAKSTTEHTNEVLPSLFKKGVILFLLFISWGINQIINDYLGLKEDKINAPHRPMVTGELSPEKAVAVSIILLVLASAITWFYLEPFAIVFLLAGVLCNVLYETAKGHGLLGNIVFGLMITTATLYGGFAAGPTQSSPFAPHRLSVLFLVFFLNAIMTYYTYFKDYRGDKLSGKNTLIVLMGLKKSRVMALLLPFIPVGAFVLLKWCGLLWIELNTTFLILGGLTVFLHFWTGYLFFKNPVGDTTYFSLKTNFQACACGSATLIALFNPQLSIYLFLFSYILVDFLFSMHKNVRA